MAFSDFFEEPLFDYEEEKRKFVENLDMLKAMSVEEHTFYKKHEELQLKYTEYLNRASVIKAKIWKPRDINNKESTIEDINNIKPQLIIVPDDSDELNTWMMIRVFCHSMTFDQTPGRFIKFIVADEPTGKYLGAISVSSDVISISCRDQFIGWTNDDKIIHKRLSNSAIGSCIMATQPFGYNFLGGKLMASLIISKTVQDLWTELYGAKLVGMTTTSLYGSCSMYNGIPYWRKCGSSAGKIPIKPDESTYQVWLNWIKEHKKEQYIEKLTQKEGVSGPVTGAKQRIINMMFREMGLKASMYEHGYERGVYYSGFYENFKEFLCGKINESDLVMKDKFKKDIQGILDWWKPKAIDRYTKLFDANQLKPEVLYYSSMVGMTWLEAKEKFLHNVGR